VGYASINQIVLFYFMQWNKKWVGKKMQTFFWYTTAAFHLRLVDLVW